MLQRDREASSFRVNCLGPFRLIEVKTGVDKTPASRKTRALLGYLAITGRAAARERLASLLWGDRGDEQARASLRQALYELRSAPGSDQLLKTERDTVCIGDNVTTDIFAIKQASAPGDLETLSNLLADWRGDLLEDLPSIDPSFDGWLQGERLRVHDALIDAAMAAVRAGMEAGQIAMARKAAGLLQQQDATNEVVLRLCLKLDGLAGDLAALHRRYERFRDLLKSELSAAPSQETQQLFQQLSRAPASSQAVEPATAPANVVTPRPVKYLESQVAEPITKSVLDHEHTVTATVSASGFRPRYIVRIGAAAFAAIVFFCGIGLAFWSFLHRHGSLHEAPMLAVMSFQNLSDNSGTRTLSERIAPDIAQALVRKKIQVATMPSDVGLASTGAPKPLSITHVLSGSVETMRGRVHVIAQLLDIRGDRVVWSHSFDGENGRTGISQTQISAQIVDAVGKVLASSELSEASNVDPVAYAYFTKGVDLYRQRDWLGAETELEQALLKAPNFAQAWSALAAARWRNAVFMLDERRNAYRPIMAQSARAAAERALALNPREGQAMGVLALLKPPSKLIEIDGQLEQSLRATPHNPQLLEWYGRFLMFVGRNHDALDKLTRAYELDNSTPSATSNLILACLKTGHYDVAKEILNREDSGTDGYSREMSARLHVKYFLYVRDWFRLADYLRVLPNGLLPRTTSLLKLMHETAIALATSESEKYTILIATWRKEAPADLDDATQALFALGDADGALDVIEAAVRSRQNDPLLSAPGWEALYDPNLVPLRRNPRVPALLEKWGLLKYWQTTNRWPDFVR